MDPNTCFHAHNSGILRCSVPNTKMKHNIIVEIDNSILRFSYNRTEFEYKSLARTVNNSLFFSDSLLHN